MKLKEITVSKSMKIGLPNYSNIDVSCGMTFDVEENETVDWDKVWDKVNQQLFIQSEGIDPSWIQTKEYSNFFKTVVKSPKNEKIQD